MFNSEFSLGPSEFDAVSSTLMLLPQGLKRSEQNALIDLFKTKVTASGGDSTHSHSDRGPIQPIRKLEKLMRF